ncbi:MAG: M1 family metallopeptidase [Saprospiraceae bacterium]
MIRKIVFVLLTSSWAFNSVAQNNSYFQQEVNYKINVNLDDNKHQLSGNIEIEYINNAPNALTEIWMHLWGNAYKNQQTGFAKQQLVANKNKFFYAKEEDKGFYSRIDFLTNNAKTKWEWDKNNPDIAIIHLDKPLQSGEKLLISTPFDLKIPASFSRLGHVDQSYQITQWYPKPAVYDNRGWHAMPYLNQGEFYSEFGSYDVSITLPENYVVGASGVLQNPSEVLFLQSRIEKTKAILDTAKSVSKKQQLIPPSAAQTKTIRYIADNVHDFAWFADKRFYVTHDVAILGSGKKVDCYAMFTDFERNLWTKGAFYVKRSVEYYSKHVGEYPYPHATAVQSALSAGGGMEYPMITVIDKAGSAKSLDIVITHEVGHNWFYGILASNEREHPWMDEGMNSFYEEAYTKAYYPKLDEKKADKKKKKSFNLGITVDEGLEDLAYQWMARREMDQPSELHAAEYLGINYGLIVYKKTAKSLSLLEQYVGQDKFNKVMQSYFSLWKFKHPYPEDFKKIWKNEIKDRDLTWFFDKLINTTENTNASIRYNNAGTPNAASIPLMLKVKGTSVPIPVNGIKNEQVVETQLFTIPAGKNKMPINFPKGNYDKIVVDYYRILPSKYRSANLNEKGKLPSKYYQPKIKAYNLVENPDRPFSIGLLPAFSYNHYDKGQLGAVFYSPFIPRAANTYAYIMPLYSFAQKQWNGNLAVYHAKYFKKAKIHKLDGNLSARTYSFNNDYNYNANSRYFRYQAGSSIDFRKKSANDPRTHSIAARIVSVTEKEPIGINFIEKQYRDTSSNYAVGELKYTYKNEQFLKPANWTVTAQYGKGFAKIFSSFNQKFVLEHKNEALYVRAFAGTFISYDNPTINVSFRTSGRPSQFNTDYMYDQLLMARSSGAPRYYYPPVGDKLDLRNTVGGSFYSQQLFMQDGGLKTLGSGLISDKWMAGGGLAYDLPLSLPFRIRPYVDIALVPENNKINSNWSAGIGAILIPDIFEIYFPIPYRDTDGWRTLESKSIYYDKRTNYVQKITFVFNINKLNPYQALRNLKLNI